MRRPAVRTRGVTANNRSIASIAHGVPPITNILDVLRTLPSALSAQAFAATCANPNLVLARVEIGWNAMGILIRGTRVAEDGGGGAVSRVIAVHWRDARDRCGFVKEFRHSGRREEVQERK